MRQQVMGNRGGVVRWKLDGHQPGGPQNVSVKCPRHGLALVPVAWLDDLVATRHARGNVQCADASPVYTRP